ncbi:MAG: hypothetical protein N3A62_00595 [Thermodesulfovibrionales bacterium]|nr:hypothetical protein [Thermodesulfovibrionales bacterium]
MKKILFICGSLNQTTMMYKIAQHLMGDYDCYFTPYYGDGVVRLLTRMGLLDFTILGGRFKRQTDEFLDAECCKIDYEGRTNNYDLVVTCSDLIVQKNIKKKNIILVQEGMTDPENFAYHLVKKLNLPRYIASTSTTGLSNAYQRFCVASEGFKKHFVNKGVKEDKIVVTGIPNFDDCQRYLKNDFPYKDYVLVATSDARETFKPDRRKTFIKRALKIADGRRTIFKLHPNEKPKRAEEIRRIAPDALIFHDGNAHEMVANCQVLITQYSSLVFTGLALNKEVYSYFDVERLKEMTPIQNGGTSAKNIAEVCKEYLQ